MNPIVGLLLMAIALGIGEAGHQTRNPWMMILALTFIIGVMIAVGHYR